MGKNMRKAIALGKSLAEENATEPCSACSGSGRYDSTGSPKCGACQGTGVQKKVRYDVPVVQARGKPRH